MTRIVVTDATTLAQFRHLADSTEVCDPSGNVLGTYSPKQAEPAPPYAVKSPYTPEQLEEFAKEPGRPLAEVWKSLGRS